nr:Chain C, Nucleoporin NUP42 [Saccharomyces cerevisiae S288C]6B4E_D Chain D, Nucleoporin NUP42 [Saccharomyces cerevisiae S288C]
GPSGSELADLAEETLKIFRANKFELGLVPDIPPPPALVA